MDAVLFVGYDGGIGSPGAPSAERVIEVDSIAGALDPVVSESITAVISEYQLPDGTAIDLTEAVHSLDRSLPVFVWTADGSAADASRASMTGVTEYLLRGTHDLALVMERVREHNTAGGPINGDARLSQAVFEEAFDAILIADDESRYVDANPAACELLGLPREEIIGRQIDDFAPPEYDFETAWESFRTADRDRGEFPLVRANGERRTVEFAASTDIIPGYHLSILRDVTERRQLETAVEAERDRAQRYLDVAGVMLVALEPDGTVRMANRRAGEVLGRSADSLVGEDWFEVAIPEDERPATREAFEGLIEGEGTGFSKHENSVRTAAGEERLIEWDNTVLRDAEGTATGTLSSGTDITARAAFEETLTDLYDSVEELLAATSQQEISRTLVGMATGILDCEGAVVYLADEAGDRLDPIVHSEGADFMRRSFPPVPIDDSSITGETFRNGETIRFDDITSSPNLQTGDTAMRAGIFAPLGGHGILIVGSAREGVFNARQERLLDLLAANAAAVYDRIDRERRLKTTTEQLSLALDTADAGVWEWDPTTDTVSCQENLERLLGVESGAADGPLHSFLEYVHPDDREQVREAITGDRDVPTREEFRIVRADGEVRWLAGQGVWVSAGTHDRFLGIGVSITELKRREAELQAEEEKFRSLVDTAPNPLFITDVQSGEVVETNRAACQLLNRPRAEIIGHQRTTLHPDEEAARYRELFDRLATEGGRTSRFPGGDSLLLATPDDTTLPVEISARPVEHEGRTLLHTIYRDVSAQRRYEHALEELNRASRQFLAAETDSEIARITVDLAAELLDVTGVSIHLYDEDTARLTPVAYSDAIESLLGEVPDLRAGESIAWRVFSEGEPARYDDVRTDPDVHNPGTPFRAELIQPLGDHGVLLAGDTAVGRFDELTVEIVTALTRTATAALDRIEGTRQLQERQREAGREAARADRLVQLNEKMRLIIEAITAMDDRRAVLQAVCDRLLELDRVALAWIGTPNLVDNRLEPGVWAGDITEPIEPLDLDAHRSNQHPGVAAADKRVPVVVSNIAEGAAREPWRRTALASDFRSVIAVPLTDDGALQGVLTLYSSRPAAFDERSVEVLGDLGELIGFGLTAVERSAGYGDVGGVELTIELPTARDPLVVLATELETELEVRNVLQLENETQLVQLVAGSISEERLVEAADNSVAIQSVEVIMDTDPSTVECTLVGPCIATETMAMVEEFRSITVGAQGSTLRVEVPGHRAVHRFLDRFTARYPDAELRARREVETRGPRSAGALLEALTDRQREVLRTAYFSGYFEEPRARTGTKVATALDISQPAFSKLLRSSQRNLLGPIYEPTDLENGG